MLRKIISIIAGYAIFVVTSLALFKISKNDPHSNPTTTFLVVTIVYGLVFSFVAGLVTRLIAKSNNLRENYILAFIIAGFAAFSLLKSEGNHWTQFLAIFVFAPASIVGGLVTGRQRRK